MMPTPLPLPVEIIHHILGELQRDDLLHVLLATRSLSSISSRVLYRTLTALNPRQWLLCLRTLLKNPTLPPLVRTLEIDWSALHPTPNLYRLLRDVLKRLTFLVTLNLELPKLEPPFWILDDCPFSLQQFTTSMPCKAPLSHFLDTQPTVKELTLRGYHGDQSSFLPLMYPNFRVLDPEGNFRLLPSSLPLLSQFRVVHAGPSLVASVVSRRPIQYAAIPLFAGSSSDVLDALCLSSSPIKRLSLISFDPDAPESLISQVSTRFPDLEALHIVILMAEYTPDVLKESGSYLAAFKALQYITFMASVTDPSADITAESERKIAKSWHSSCPTLRTIILPRGRVWFGGNGDWSCSEMD